MAVDQAVYSDILEGRRLGVDRRVRPTPMVSRYLLSGRRRGGRRGNEASGIYVDRFTPAELGIAAWVALASVLDLVLTIVHLRAGGSEANPVLAWLLAEYGEWVFGAVKLSMTTFGALFLLLHARFPLARLGLLLGAAVYAALLIWHGVVAAGRIGLLV